MVMSASDEDDHDYWSKHVDYLDGVQDILKRLAERFRQEEEEMERLCEEEERGRVN